MREQKGLASANKTMGAGQGGGAAAGGDADYWEVCASYISKFLQEGEGR